VPHVATSCARLVGAARAAHVPVMWTRVEYEPGGANGGIWYRKIAALSCFDRGNPLGAWLDGLTPLDLEHVVTKQHASGFFGTDLADRLRRDDIDTVVIGGVSTSGCVRATATDASAHGFVPIVVRQAVGDRNPHVHEANLFDLNAKYADVVDEADVVAAFGA
jgi:maleamate amidohydrolase